MDAEKERLRLQLWSALDHVRQLLLNERPPEEVAWWLRANHEWYLNDRREPVRLAIEAMADKAETMGELSSH